ncbi:MAG: hypothetical protein JW927_02630 [Deltaproteobacteria bacterium]|nr:hypothetical protein [Deltaproteobacteria bacterium]
MGLKTLSRRHIEFDRLTKKYLMNSNHRGLIFLLIITSIIILASCAVEQKKKPVNDSMNKSISETERKLQYECSEIRDRVYSLRSKIHRFEQLQLRQVRGNEVENDYQRAMENNQRIIDKVYLQIDQLESHASYIGCTR